MAQTTRPAAPPPRPAAAPAASRPTAQTAEPSPAAKPVAVSPPAMPAVGPGSLVSDRHLIDQLRAIYQLAERHKPLPAGTDVHDKLIEALAKISDIAEEAVTGYQPK